MFIHNPCGENINRYSYYFGSPYSKFVSVSTAKMDAKDVYEKNSVLREFVKTLEPDIADKDLQGFINDFLGIKDEVKEVAVPFAEKEPTPTTLNTLNQQNHVLINLLKEAVFQFLEKKYQEEKANRRPLEQHLIEKVEKEDDANSYHLVEELGSMGISKISTESIQVTTSPGPKTVKKHLLQSKYIVALSLLGMGVILTILVVFFNQKSENTHHKVERDAIPPSASNVIRDDTLTSKIQETTVSSKLPLSTTHPASPSTLRSEVSLQHSESKSTDHSSKENRAVANADKKGHTRRSEGFAERHQIRAVPKKGESRKETNEKKSTQHEQVYFAEQE